MKKKLLLILILSSVMVLAIIPTFATAATNNFEIYPTPHIVNYGGTTCTFPENVAMYLGESLDEVTVARAYEALSQIDVLVTNSGSEKYAFYFGVFGSGDIADRYFKDNDLNVATANLFEKTDAYYLAVGKKATLILGKDTNAAYYGLTTLKIIFNQVTNRKMQLITVEDWSDSIYRGFIEGYYGVPWTTDERVELMRFGGEFKTNIYIYAPKNDPYHSTNWRSLYKDADLQELKEQVEAGRQSKTRFVWAAHPFNHSPILKSDYQSGISALLAKFEQMYSIGVRQFVVSADDIDGDTVGGINKTMWDTELARMTLNDVASWCKQKGDCFNTIFVPNVYFTTSSASRPNSSGQNEIVQDSLPQNYLPALVEGLDESVEIMWTGNKVCSSVSKGDFDKFTAWSGRKAFMWLNWPVNDYADGKLIMSKGEVLDLSLKSNAEAPFIGIVTNPMQYAEADKLSIFATADYAWNINGFNVDKSYQDSFKYIEPNATDEFYEICKHLANASKFENRYFEESAELSVFIDKFLNDFSSGDDYNQSAEELISQFNTITQAGERFLSNAENKKLVECLEPFVQSLIYKTQACAKYIKVLRYFEEWDKEKLSAEIQSADETLAMCKQCVTPVLNKITYDREPTTVDVGIAVINVFLKQIDDIYSEKIKPLIGLPTVTYKGFDSVYQGAIENVTDGDDNSFVWFGSYPSAESSIRVGLGEVTTVKNIRILTGDLKGNDVWNVIVEYSVDGINYTSIKTVSGALNVIDLRDNPIEASFIRIRDNSDKTTWVAIREITVNVDI